MSHRGRPSGSVDAEEFAELVLQVVESIPEGRAMSYGQIAAVVAAGGPRRVGAVMSRVGATVTWWRVVRADGSLPEQLRDEARARYLDEGTPLRDRSGLGIRVDMSRASWSPAAP